MNGRPTEWEVVTEKPSASASPSRARIGDVVTEVCRDLQSGDQNSAPRGLDDGHHLEGRSQDRDLQPKGRPLSPGVLLYGGFLWLTRKE